MKKGETDYLILGNSTAAVGAIEGIRSLDREGSITLLTPEPYHAYSRPLITYLLAGEINEGRMYYRPLDYYENKGVDARLGTGAVKIDTSRRTVAAADGSVLKFKRLLLAAGSNPVIPDIKGLDARGIFTMVSWDDAKAVKKYLESNKVQRAVVIGGGLIGLKTLEALVKLNLRVSLVELAERVLVTSLDKKASELVLEHLLNLGVDVRLGRTATEVIAFKGRVKSVSLDNGTSLPAELVVIAVGVSPNTGIVKDTPIKVDKGIIVDEAMMTSVPDIYAAGDITQAVDFISGVKRPIPIFPNAYRQGYVAGRNMAGGQSRFTGGIPMNSLEVLGLPTISVGITEPAGDGFETMVKQKSDPDCYKKFVIKDNRLVGAVFLGDIDRAGIITGLIKEKIDISDFRDNLLTEDFGIISLPKEYRKHIVSGEGVEV